MNRWQAGLDSELDQLQAEARDWFDSDHDASELVGLIYALVDDVVDLRQLDDAQTDRVRRLANLKLHELLSDRLNVEGGG